MCWYSISILPPCKTNFKFKHKSTMSTFSLSTANDMSAFNCTSKTCKHLPQELQSTIANYVESMYVHDQRKYDLAERAHMCAYRVKEQIMKELEAVKEDLAYARLWYENEVRDTEKMLYENKGKATDAAIEAAMVTRLQLEDERYQDYLREATNYNNFIDEKKELLKTAGYTWVYAKETIDERTEDRRFIAEDWITKREIDDGLWDPQGYVEDKDAQEDKNAPIHPLDDDGPAIGSGCWGCAEHQPNQEAHMGPGGCLHMSSDSETEDGFIDLYYDDVYEDYSSDDDEPW